MLKTKKNKIPFSLIFSISIHFSILLTFKDEIQLFNEKNKLDQASTISEIDKSIGEVKLITTEQLKAIKRNLNIQNQIVTTESRGEEVTPINSKFLGEKNNLVNRQTVARVIDSFKKAGVGSKDSKVHGNDFESEQIKKNRSAKNKLHSLNDLGGFGLMAAKSEIESELEEKAKLANLKKSKRQGLENGDESLSGFASNNDHVEEIALGDMTNLNTHEYKYYGFYQRIKSQLEQHWGQTIKEEAKKIYKSGRRMPASDNLVTAVAVILDEKGQIVQIKIEGSSGIRELDQAAIESFNKAGPFPNPPKGLLVDGRATIQWGFVVKS